MFNMGSAPSLADIAAVTKDGNGDGWGNGNGWWVLRKLWKASYR